MTYILKKILPQRTSIDYYFYLSFMGRIIPLLICCRAYVRIYRSSFKYLRMDRSSFKYLRCVMPHPDGVIKLAIWAFVLILAARILAFNRSTVGILVVNWSVYRTRFRNRKPVIPENELARGIQSKSIRGLEAGGLGGWSLPNIIFFFWIRLNLEWHCEGKIQNGP